MPWQGLPDAILLTDEGIDSLTVRRALAAASVAVLGDFRDNEVECTTSAFLQLRFESEVQ